MEKRKIKHASGGISEDALDLGSSRRIGSSPLSRIFILREHKFKFSVDLQKVITWLEEGRARLKKIIDSFKNATTQ